jgi:glucosamine-6-phosphate deaminase
LGTDGHIGFNEPRSSLSSRTRLKTLTPRTIKDNAHHFASEADAAHVITMGSARSAKRGDSGAGDRRGQKPRRGDDCRRADNRGSASISQMHRKCILIVDEAAASTLKRRLLPLGEHKPAWQRI